MRHRRVEAEARVPATAIARPSSQTDGRMDKVPGNLRPIEAPKARGHIGQQQPGHAIAQRHADQPRKDGEGQKLHHQQDHKHVERHSNGAERAQHRAALFEGEADCGMDDEQPHREAQESEGREVEVKAVRQPRKIAFSTGRAEPEIGHHLCERPCAFGLLRPQQQAGELSWRLEQLLGNADVRERRSGGQRVRNAQRWRRDPRKAVCRFRRDNENTWGRDEGRKADVCSGHVNLRGLGRQGERVDPQNAQPLPSEALFAFENGGDQPPRLAQRDIGLLADPRSVFMGER